MTRNETPSGYPTTSIVDDVASVWQSLDTNKDHWVYSVKRLPEKYSTEKWDWISDDPKERAKQLADFHKTLTSVTLSDRDKFDLSGAKLSRILKSPPS